MWCLCHFALETLPKGAGKRPLRSGGGNTGLANSPHKATGFSLVNTDAPGQHSEPRLTGSMHVLSEEPRKHPLGDSGIQHSFFFSKGQKNKGKAAANSVEALTAKEQITSLMEEALPLRLK